MISDQQAVAVSGATPPLRIRVLLSAVNAKRNCSSLFMRLTVHCSPTAAVKAGGTLCKLFAFAGGVQARDGSVLSIFFFIRKSCASRDALAAGMR